MFLGSTYPKKNDLILKKTSLAGTVAHSKVIAGLPDGSPCSEVARVNNAWFECEVVQHSVKAAKE